MQTFFGNMLQDSVLIENFADSENDFVNMHLGKLVASNKLDFYDRNVMACTALQNTHILY